jgi:hypothetical protein
MDLLVGIGLLVLVALPLWLALRRSTQLFSVRAIGQKLELTQGRVPPRLLEDLHDVLRRASADGATIRVIAESGRPRAIVTGVDAATAQRVRNVVGTWNVAQIRAGRRRA